MQNNIQWSSLPRNSIRFLLGFEEMELIPARHDQTLLEFLRLDQKLIGTKEGCAEGDCGACTVIIGEIIEGRLHYSPVNACIFLTASLDGKQLFTVEHLSHAALSTNGINPVQQAMVESHATQCGFCTPGIVNAITVLLLNGGKYSDDSICEALVGNLCRCTGYGPIIAAARQAIQAPMADGWWAMQAASQTKLEAWIKDTTPIYLTYPYGSFIKTYLIQDIMVALKHFPTARLVAGATDVGLWITKQGRDLPIIINISDTVDLLEVEVNQEMLTIGAGVGYERALILLEREYADFGNLIRRIGSAQVRSRGTIGGNIANGSPIGDTPPALMALGAEISLINGMGVIRRIALKDFFITYGKQDRATDEVLIKIHIPRQLKGNFRAYKISKRFDQDITAVLACFYCEQDEAGMITSISLCYGGMAGIPAHAKHTEAALLGQFLNEAIIAKAKLALLQDFKPLSDMRASADYRMMVAGNLLERFYEDISQKEAVIRLEQRQPLANLWEGSL